MIVIATLPFYLLCAGTWHVLPYLIFPTVLWRRSHSLSFAGEEGDAWVFRDLAEVVQPADGRVLQLVGLQSPHYWPLHLLTLPSDSDLQSPFEELLWLMTWMFAWLFGAAGRIQGALGTGKYRLTPGYDQCHNNNAFSSCDTPKSFTQTVPMTAPPRAGDDSEAHLKVKRAVQGPRWQSHSVTEVSRSALGHLLLDYLQFLPRGQEGGCVNPVVFILLNLLGWHWLIKLHRFQVYKPTKYRLVIVLCVCHQTLLDYLLNHVSEFLCSQLAFHFIFLHLSSLVLKIRPAFANGRCCLNGKSSHCLHRCLANECCSFSGPSTFSICWAPWGNHPFIGDSINLLLHLFTYLSKIITGACYTSERVLGDWTGHEW